MAHTIRDIATALGAEAAGNLDLTVSCAAEPHSAGPEALALALDPKYAGGLAKGQARAAMLWPGADWQELGLEAAIFAPRGRLAMAGLSRMLDAGPAIAPGVHAMSVIDPTAEIGAGAAIGPFVTIGAGVRIGPNARIAGHVSIAEGATIGADALILQGARIGARVTIGDRFICQPGAVIGADGFSFVTPERSGVEEIRSTLGQRDEIREQSWTRIHSLGAVTIGDDVEIGANACIDRGTIRDTAIGSGTKLDNLVHIGHNVQVGRDCLLCGQVGIAGSSRIGDRVVLAGQCGVNDNIFVGDDVIAGGATKIFTNAPAGRVLLGYPAVKMETQIEINKALRRLPRLAAAVAELQKVVAKS
ncbi:MAG: UDP-3-O-(3-hydroxymyristoyl)glucosamine N-acyltransferase [Rhodobacterales bacterium 65-51]|jgi:UDP-3-O-[3-hydroxymyristoyl] glucosamine N-acyltransferase|uniref:UDP-3-O-(3-hydroxymyristoyl)glucosamine N-acyltransferase n=1 Tax=Gemmobacter nanjingensis TaxID=488454 RepID=A0ABQ3FPX0_9RHOB|nr:UDP-3-O-(3-hydroxymyristoyl)glucosamine N-acyltransferase [Gemmobacter nanjingensis]OJY27071.1 MAG: UDP-3-O-(3-hydroxymyristoyl)glucosamine N-acyltransferase [Rhodobacterales bacterium 65-51]GHC33030.1 UDP-3-O-(3-hydroxymyristoyl)glucosamine N-acyltransferase [Gemmobacter nanjingensis]